MTQRHETALGLCATAAAGAATTLALSILSTAVGGMKFGGNLRLWWSAEPLVLLAELAMAGLAVAIAVGSIRRMWLASTSRGRIIGWLGLGWVALGVVSLASAWAGLQVPSPGIDMLERGEMWYLIGGIPAIVVGLLLALGGFASADPGVHRSI